MRGKYYTCVMQILVRCKEKIQKQRERARVSRHTTTQANMSKCAGAGSNSRRAGPARPLPWPWRAAGHEHTQCSELVGQAQALPQQVEPGVRVAARAVGCQQKRVAALVQRSQLAAQRARRLRHGGRAAAAGAGAGAWVGCVCHGEVEVWPPSVWLFFFFLFGRFLGGQRGR